MAKKTNHSLAAEIDRTKKLQLSEMQFQTLVLLLNEYEEPQVAANYITLCDGKAIVEFLYNFEN